MAATQHTANEASLLAELPPSAHISSDDNEVLNTFIRLLEPEGNAYNSEGTEIELRSELDAVSRVFQTAELLELILVHLPPEKLIQVQRTCKDFQEAINGSPPIRRRLFREADYDCAFTLNPISFCGIHIDQHSSDLRGVSSWVDEMTCDRLRSYAGLQDVLLAQPPLLATKIQRSCVDRSLRSQMMGGAVCSNPAGITIGNVLETLGDLCKRQKKENMVHPKIWRFHVLCSSDDVAS